MGKKRGSASRSRKTDAVVAVDKADDDVDHDQTIDVASSVSPPLSPRTKRALDALDAPESNHTPLSESNDSFAPESNLPATLPPPTDVSSDRKDNELLAPTATVEDDALLPALLMRTHALDSASSCSSLAPPPRSRSIVLNDNSTVLQAMPTSKVEVVEVVAEQSWLLTKLTVQLLWALRASQKWILMALRLVTFVVLLLPALLRMVAYWAWDAHVHKHLIYGVNGRNLLDVYTVPSDKIIKPTSQQLDKKKNGKEPTDAPPQDVAHLKRPVVVFISGGAWIIGYKGWGALMGKALAAFGVVVVMPDYRNFPQGILPNMVDDATMALQWVFDHIHHFGGDPENVTLVGQSAGAHIAMCTLLEQIEKRAQRLAAEATATAVGASSPSSYSSCSGFSMHSVGSDGGLPQVATWDVRQIRTFIGISGPYNIGDSIETFHRHGFDRSVVDRIMDHRIAYFSPALRLFSYSEHARAHDLLNDFPPAYLYHGTSDMTVTWKSSEQLAGAMETCGLSVEAKYFDGKTHTDIIIEDPISGSDDLLLGQIIEVLKARSPRDERGVTAFEFPQKFTPPRQYYPAVLVKMARSVNPF